MLSKFRSTLSKVFEAGSRTIEHLYTPFIMLKGVQRPDTSREDELESALKSLYDYTGTLEKYYSVWHFTRPTMAPMPENAEEVGNQVRKALRIDK